MTDSQGRDTAMWHWLWSERHVRECAKSSTRVKNKINATRNIYITFISPSTLHEVHARTTYAVLLFKNICSDFCQTNNLNIYQNDLHEICRICKTFTAYKRSEVIFLTHQGMSLWRPIFSTKSTCDPHLVVRMTFARAVAPAYNKKGNCYAGYRQTNYLIWWTQANQLSNKLTIINRQLEG